MSGYLVTAAVLLVTIVVCVAASRALRSWMRSSVSRGDRPAAALALVLVLCVTLYALGTFAVLVQVLLGVAPAAVLGIIVTVVTGVSVWNHDGPVVGWLLDGGDGQSEEEK